MSENEILKEIKEYFDIRELVDKETYDKYGEKAWQFMCPRLLHTMLVIRKELDKSITVNNWHIGGSFSQRGLRTNMQPIVKAKKNLYLSAHLMGRALDFDVKGMTSHEVRNWLVANASKLPYPIRLENKFAKTGKEITWVHLDVFYNDKNSKVYLFNV